MQKITTETKMLLPTWALLAPSWYEISTKLVKPTPVYFKSTLQSFTFTVVNQLQLHERPPGGTNTL